MPIRVLHAPAAVGGHPSGLAAAERELGLDSTVLTLHTPPFGYGFSIIVEAKPGASGVRVGNSAFTDGGAPDLQIQVTRPLGDASLLVCDDAPPIIGGVPAIA